jgi:ribosomal protein L31
MIFFLSCEESVPTGSEDVDEFESVVFVVTSKEVTDNTFFVEGTIENTGSETFTPIWYMEAQFYTDQQKSLKLGGSVDSFNFSLENGETTQWSLRYSNSDQNLNNYQNFGIGNFRAYKR